MWWLLPRNQDALRAYRKVTNADLEQHVQRDLEGLTHKERPEGVDLARWRKNGHCENNIQGREKRKRVVIFGEPKELHHSGI